MPRGKERFDVCFIAAVIASMRTDSLSDILFYCRHKVVQAQIAESEICSFQAAG